MSQIHSSRFNIYCFPLLLVVLWSVIAQPAIAVDVTPSAELSALADRFIETRMDLNPLMATWITGEARYEDKFVNDLTPEFRAKERAMFAETLAAIKKIGARNLAESDRLTRAVLQYQVNNGLQATKYDFYLTPINQFNSMPLTLIQLASTKGAQPFRTVANYEHFLTRVDGFPAWVESAIANMREGMAKGVVQPKVLMLRVLPQLKSQIVSDPVASGFYVPVKNFPPTFGEEDRARLTSA